MDEKFTLSHEGNEYTVERGASVGEATTGGGAPAGRNRWYITLGPKAITTLPAEPGETDSALRERIRRWLSEHPEMPSSEDIIFGGG